jgi:flagella basal body P-ring formation protein FlgA
MLHLIVLGVALTGPVPAAIERSIQERMGEVRVEVLELNGAGGRPDDDAMVRCEGPTVRCDGPTVRWEGPKAIPAPGSRLGRPIRFILFANGARIGSVIATLSVTGSAVRSSRNVSRGEGVVADAIEVADIELAGMLVDRLPTADEIVGSQARRAIRAGEVMTNAALLVPPVVKSGDEVRVSVSTGAIELTSTGRASGSGRVGDLIRVLVPTSRKGLKARITGPGSVEIVR